MSTDRYIEIHSNPGTVPLESIPMLEYPVFESFIDRIMGEEGTHCLAYFVLRVKDTYRFFCCMAADEHHSILICSHEVTANDPPALPSLTKKHFQFTLFEREIHENTGIGFTGHPWLKPVRYPFDRAVKSDVMETYPFYSMDGDELHEVGVGPVHAGIIEPGYFRFICHGEQVLHLEIQLGYQHRGVERLFAEKQGTLQQSVLSESIAGDTAVGHAFAYTSLIESLAGVEVSPRLSAERAIALELERVAVHIGDTAALCTDIAYQFGQVVNEALRTIVINTTQLWCGNRFGKGLIRPGGTNYPLSREIMDTILKNLKEVEERYDQVTARLFSLPSVLGRFEGTGKLTAMQASLIGAVGMAARSSGMYRDIRWSHPFSAYVDSIYEPVMLQGGDVMSRAQLRKLEVGKSIAMIRELIRTLTESEIPNPKSEIRNPKYDLSLAPSSLVISLVEGWRGEICHVALTDDAGRIMHYKVKDPSFHNWTALAVAVRDQEISDFPLCNKSFDLSYCGNDL